MISHLKLQKQNNLSESVSLHCDPSGFEFLIIEHAKFNAAFALHGAHLLHFQIKKQPPIIWLSKTAMFHKEKAIRGGVPICWPWFGPADKSLGDNLPAHGFARTSLWAINQINELTDGIELEFLLKDSEQTHKIWPYSFELVLKATLTDTIKLELVSKNTGTTPFNYRSALHSYFHISAPAACHISGLNKHYCDSLNAGVAKSGNGSLQIKGAIDSIYQKADATVVLDDSGFNRKINISASGNDSEVLWTPWIEGAKAFADMPDNGYQTMFCIESAITNKNGQKIETGQSHTLTTEIH